MTKIQKVQYRWSILASDDTRPPAVDERFLQLRRKSGWNILDTVPNLEEEVIPPDDLVLNPLNDSTNELYYERIILPSLGRKLAEKRQLRRQRKLLSLRISKKAFRQIVWFRTSRLRIRVWTGRWRRFGQTRVHQHAVYIRKSGTYLDWSRDMVKEANRLKKPLMREKYRKLQLWYEAHPRQGNSHRPTEWRVFSHMKFHVETDPTGGKKVKVYRIKTVHPKDWLAIHEDWRRLKESVRNRIAIIDRQIDDINVVITSLRQRVSNQMDHPLLAQRREAWRFSLSSPVIPRLCWDHSRPSVEVRLGLARRVLPTFGVGAVHLSDERPGSPVYYSVEKYDGSISWLEPIDHEWFSNRRTHNVSRATDLLGLFTPGDFKARNWVPPNMLGFPSEQVIRWGGSPLGKQPWESFRFTWTRSPGSSVWNGPGDYPVFPHNYNHPLWYDSHESSGTCLSPSTLRLPLLIQDPEDSDIRLQLRNIEAESTQAIRNLKPNGLVAKDGSSRAESSFNLTRSVGELKDTPQTSKQVKSFLEWIGSGEAIGRKAYRVRSRKGHSYWTFAAPAATSRSRVIKTMRISGRSRLPMLASCYLAWRFAVQPTYQDAMTVVKKGMEYIMWARRGLHLALQKAGAYARHVVTLRHHLTATDIPGFVPGCTSKEGYVEHSSSDSRTVAFVDRFDLNPILEQAMVDSHQPLALLGSLPVIKSEVYGFLMIDPRVEAALFGLRPDALKRCFGYNNVGELTDALEEYNAGIVRSRLVDEHMLPAVRIYRHIRLVTWAHYAYQMLRKRAGSLLKGSLWDRLGKCYDFVQPLVTAWELFPLSFVVDWFVNTRQIVEAVQNKASACFVPATPIGKIWRVVRTTIWCSPPASSHLELSMVRVAAEGPTHMYVEQEYHSYNDSSNKEFEDLTAAAYLIRPYLRVKIKASFSQTHRAIWKTGLRRVLRYPTRDGVGLLPFPRWKVNLNLGKLTSLLAMWVSTRRAPRR